MAKFLLVVQGEGRGHMTQAITLQNILLDAGHTVCEVLMGKSRNGQTPEFVKKLIHCPIGIFESPCFVMDSKNKSIQLLPSILNNFARLKTFRKSLAFLRGKINEHRPDAIINFYEPLIGLCYLFNRPSMPLACIAHQYIYHHPGFEFPVKGRMNDKIAIKLYTSLTSFGAKKKFALSFYPINDNCRRSIVGMPPLLRQDVFEIKTETRNYLLIYLAISGYTEDIIDWHKKNPNVELHCFTDKITEYDTVMHGTNLFFHKLDDKKFLEMMASARGLVTTAGFESVCEAMYLGKPVFMVPVQGHFEQYCNARDAAKAGAGIYDDAFNLEKFISYLSSRKTENHQFRAWVDSGRERFLQQIHEMLPQEEAVMKLSHFNL